MRILPLLIFTLFQFLNAQYSWTTISLPNGGKVKNILSIDTNILFCSNDIAAFISYNQGMDWTRLPLTEKMYGMNISIGNMDKDTLGNIYARYFSSSLYYVPISQVLLPNSWTFIAVFDGPTYMNNSIKDFLVTLNGGVYASTSTNSNLYYSTDFSGPPWKSWQRKDTGLPADQSLGQMLRISDSLLIIISGSNLYKTTNSGSLWSYIGADIARTTKIASSNSGILFAANGQTLNCSLDTGKTWNNISKISALAPSSIKSIYFDTDDSVIVNTYGGLYAISEETGLFKRVDDGDNQLNSQINEITIAKNRKFYAATDNGVFYSIDDGKNWSSANSGLTNIYVYNIILTNTNILFAATGEGLFKSYDDGYHWVKTNYSAWIQNISVGFAGEIYCYDRYVLQRSTDEGLTWSNYQQSMPGLQVHDFCVDSVTQAYYIACSAGIKRSTDYGISWQSVSSYLDTISFWKIVCPQSQILYTGRYFTSNDGGDLYKIIDTEIKSFEKKGSVSAKITAFAFKDSTTFYIGTDIGLFMTQDAGQTFSDITPSNLDSTAKIINNLDLHGNNLTVGTRHGCFSVSILDTILQWTFPKISRNNQRIISSSNIFWDLMINDNIQGLRTLRDNTICAGGTSGRIYRGLQKISAQIHINPNKLAFGTVKIGNQKDMLVNITNYGLDTLDIYGITSSHFAFSAQPQTMKVPPGYSCADTIRFFPTSSTMLNENIIITCNTTNSPIILNVSGNGTLLGVDNKDPNKPKYFNLQQNYPNPFNPSTAISFDIPLTSFVSLKIFDLLGREIATIISEEMQAGSYIRYWNASNISGGIYFYRLQTGFFTETKKLVLLR